MRRHKTGQPHDIEVCLNNIVDEIKTLWAEEQEFGSNAASTFVDTADFHLQANRILTAQCKDNCEAMCQHLVGQFQLIHVEILDLIYAHRMTDNARVQTLDRVILRLRQLASVIEVRTYG